jgi:hypothetical protein
MFVSDIGMASVFTRNSTGAAFVLTTSFEFRYALLLCGGSQRAFGLHATSKNSTLRLGHRFYIRFQLLGSTTSNKTTHPSAPTVSGDLPSCLRLVSAAISRSDPK